jgi:hypothetical protein
MSNRGRKAAPEPTPQTDVLDREALHADSAALTLLGQRSAEVAERFGDGLAYERSRVVNETRFFIAQSAEAMLEVGKRLIQLKENEEHGDFAAIVSESLGITARSAQLMMQASVKFLAPALASNAKALSLLGRAKLFNLMSESDEDLAELAQGGTVAGLELDDIAAMTTRELRAALKKERSERTKDVKAKQKVIDGKTAKLDALEAQLARRESAEPTELEKYQLDALREAGLAAEMAVRQLLGQAGSVLDAPASELAATAARHAVEFVAQVFAGLINERGVPVDFVELVQPHWLKGLTPAKPAKPAKSANG